MAHDWSRKRGDRHPSMAAQLYRKIKNPDNTITIEYPNLGSALGVASIIKMTALVGGGTLPAALIDTSIPITDAVNGWVRYDPSTGFAGLPAGECTQEYEVKWSDGSRETFPADEDKPYITGIILQDLGDS